MFNGKYNTFLTVLLIIAIVAIIGLLGYLGYSIYNKYYINAEAKDVVDAFEQTYGKDTNTVVEQKPNENNNIIGQNNVVIGPVSEDNSIFPENTGNTENNNQKVTYNGYDVIGTISIPSINIQYPILEKVTTKALKVGICYLSGPGVNEVGNTVYQGHNYRNGTMFSNLSKLANGADIYLTDTAGNKVQYKVYRNFEAKATDGSFFNRDTEGKREITLSTCTEDTAIRTIVFAREV